MAITNGYSASNSAMINKIDEQEARVLNDQSISYDDKKYILS